MSEFNEEYDVEADIARLSAENATLREQVERLEKALRKGSFHDFAFASSCCDNCGGEADECPADCYVRELAALLGDGAALAQAQEGKT